MRKTMKTIIWLLCSLLSALLKIIKIAAASVGMIFLISLIISVFRQDTAHNLMTMGILAVLCLLAAWFVGKLAEPMLKKIIQKTEPAVAVERIQPEVEPVIQQDTKQSVSQEHFNPWTDEWYGNGPWWKPW